MRTEEVQNTMKPVPFDPASDLPPTPFDQETCSLARQLKDSGLPWRPHAGCFVWDPAQWIKPPSPFPNRVYFILSLPRFVEIFGSPAAIQEKLVWLPTWHQARLLCRRCGAASSTAAAAGSPEDDLRGLYRALLAALGADPADRG